MSERKGMRWDEAAMRQFQARAGRWTSGTHDGGVVVDTNEDTMRRAAKIDANQPEIVYALRAAGASVTILSAVGEGCPDLLVGYQGMTFPIEIKDGSLPPSARTLTPEQKRWHAEFKGRAYIANNVDDALLIIGAIKPKEAA